MYAIGKKLSGTVILQGFRHPELPLDNFIAYGAGPATVVVQQIQVRHHATREVASLTSSICRAVLQLGLIAGHPGRQLDASAASGLGAQAA